MPVLAKDLLKLENLTVASQATWSVERSAFLADVLRNHGALGQSVAMKVHGESMLPTLWPGDVVEIESCSMDAVCPGQVVLAQRDGRLFLHRLVAHFNSGGFQLRGDSMPAPDPVFPPEALIGKLVVDSRAGLIPSLFFEKISRGLGLILCHCGPARRLALKLHGRRKRSETLFAKSEASAESEVS